MATFTGKDGIFKVGATQMLQAKSWTIESSAEPIDNSVIGTTWKQALPGMYGYTLSVEGYYDTADTAQGTMLIGDLVTFELFPAGEVTGEKVYSGTAYVTGLSDAASFDGMVEANYSMQGTGELLQGTAT